MFLASKLLCALLFPPDLVVGCFCPPGNRYTGVAIEKKMRPIPCKVELLPFEGVVFFSSFSLGEDHEMSS